MNFPRGLDANAYVLSERGNASASESSGCRTPRRDLARQGRSVVPVAAPIAEPASPLAAAREPLTASTASPSIHRRRPLALEQTGDDIACAIGDRTYRVRGLAKNLSPDALRVNLLAQRGDEVHVDTLDLYVARSRGAFIAQAAVELAVSEETIKRDVGAVILALEPLVAGADRRRAHAAPVNPPAPAMSDAEREAALALLRDPQLLDRILADFERAGVVGEATNKLVAYLAAVSRKLPGAAGGHHPEREAAGKTSLMDAVLAFVPPEHRVQYSAMTGQALFYMAESDLKHKVLAVVEEEGAERASYALEAAAERGRAHDREHGQGSRDGQADHARVSGGRPGDDHAHHHRGGAG